MTQLLKRKNKRWNMTEVSFLRMAVQTANVGVVAAELGMETKTVYSALKRYKIKIPKHLWQNNICLKCGVRKKTKHWKGEYRHGTTTAYSYDDFQTYVFAVPKCPQNQTILNHASV